MERARALDIGQLWSRRDLLFHLFRRDIQRRYKQSAFGVLWAIARPLTMMLVLTFTFGEMAGLPSGGVPYPVYVLSGLIAWQLLSQSVSAITASVISNRVIVERVYCPRLLLPVSATLSGLFDFLIALALYLGLSLLSGVLPSWRICLLPGLVALAILVSLSVGLWCAAIGVWYRDVKFVVAYALRLLIFVTPVGYGAASLPERYRSFLAVNPFAGVVELFRSALLGTPLAHPVAVATSLAVAAVLLTGGVLFFARAERSFADVI